MNLKLELKRLFCVGPIGFLLTIIIWVGAIKLENAMDIPKMIINPTFKNFLLIIFLIDAVYLFLGSQLTLKPKERGKVLITHGPFRYIRHPIYSAIIFSGSGIMAVWNESWIVLAFVLPLSLFWSWLVQKEENYMITIFGKQYEEYQEKTGQFLPSWKAIKKEPKE
jgi:protein-S-isoprenylcysteine O-methyltransferase Ste14